MSLQTYALIIQYSSPIAVNGSKRGSIFLNCVDDVTVNEDSEITTHPMVNGDLIADHMVKQPISLSFSGSASLNGSNGSVDIFNIDQEGSFADAFAIRDLTQFENIFSEIKNVGALCTISKISQAETPCFRTYKNLALNSISFTEKINSVNFAFSFTQVMLADVQELQVDKTDQFLPAITDANELSFVDTFIDMNQLYAYVEAACYSLGIVTEEFLNIAKEQQTAAFIGASAAVAGGVTIGLGVALASNPVGWIIAGVGAAAAGVATLGYSIYSAITKYKNSKQYRIKQFEAFKDDAKNKKEVERYFAFVGNIMTSLQSLNDEFRVLQIPSNEPQQCLLTVADDYYIFEFYINEEMTNHYRSPYMLTVTNQSDGKEYVSSYKVASAKSSFDKCTSTNALFRAAGTGAYVHLIYIGDSASGQGADLTNYVITISGVKPEDLWNEIDYYIRNAILWNPGDA